MFKEIEVFETVDGKRHDTKQKASEHVLNTLRDALDGQLAGLMNRGKISSNDRYEIVMAILPNEAEAIRFASLFSRWINH